jgi:hypothetical protein
MKTHFAPCESCGRHIRVSERACPFCDSATSAAFRARSAPLPPSKRLSRAALLVFGAASATAAACGSSSVDPGTTTDAGGDAIATDAGTDTLSSTDTSPRPDTPMFEAAYGGPPDTGFIDTAKPDTAPEEDTSIDAPAPPYGIPPPPPDAGDG